MLTTDLNKSLNRFAKSFLKGLTYDLKMVEKESEHGHRYEAVNLKIDIPGSNMKMSYFFTLNKFAGQCKFVFKGQTLPDFKLAFKRKFEEDFKFFPH